ncbi:MAG: hypothetical protein H0V44_18580 [Planctomycetes bacterium]|nr:hypothetical protein [Planctomycetota bacterium]
MDPSLATCALDHRPAQVEAHAALLPGAFVPVIVPLDTLPARQRALLLVGREDLPLDVRVTAALDAEQPEAAWSEVARLTAPLASVRRLEAVLTLWAAREAARLQLPAPTGGVILAGDRSRVRLADDATGALSDVYALLDPWPWPRWCGPVVAVIDDHAVPGLAGADAIVRPALPLVRVRQDAADKAGIRPAFARAFCLLAVRSTVPPRTGWPAWLEQGLVALADARARDEVVSPRRMRELRHATGARGIAAALAAAAPDARLAMAICSPLLHPDRRKHLPALLDLLRNGAGSEGALRVAYGMTPETLALDQ